MYGGVNSDYGRQEAAEEEEEDEESRNPRLEAQGRDAQSKNGRLGQPVSATPRSPTSEALARADLAGHGDRCGAGQTVQVACPQLRSLRVSVHVGPTSSIQPRDNRPGRNRMASLTFL